VTHKVTEATDQSTHASSTASGGNNTVIDVQKTRHDDDVSKLRAK